jgi:hypothetical protein
MSVVVGSRKKDQLAEVLRHALDTSNNKYADIDEEDDFQVRLFFPKESCR